MVTQDTLGFDRVGAGERRIVVLNDWLCDTSTWDGARAYLDEEKFSWAFVDLRGYGRSKGCQGRFTVEEAAGDVLRVADSLGWDHFSILGHSMSTLVALHLAQREPGRIEAAVVITPPPPQGFGVDNATLEAMRSIALGDDDTRLSSMKANWGERLSDGWTRYKVRRWRECAEAEAVAGYVKMFAQDGMPDSTTRISVPVLAVTGEVDVELMRRDAVLRILSPLCERLTVQAISTSGHYPMQEAPPLVVALVERFLSG